MEEKTLIINASKQEIIDIFKNTKVIAIVGLSPDATKDSHQIALYLQNVGFKIVPIYPKEEIILGQKVYSSLSDVPFPIDMVNVFRKSNAIDAIVDEIIENRNDIKTIWLQLGIINNQASQKAKASGISVVQDKCTKVEHKNLFK